jgi:bifunctional DNase/RNase
MGGRVRRVQITRVENSTYYGEIHIERSGGVVHVDSRPSDAIAIAIRVDAPIFAAESLLVEPGDDDDTVSEEISLPGQSGESSELSAEQLKEYLEHLRPEDFGKFNL